MFARSHWLRQEVHHGELELWLINMHLEGTETHTHKPTHASEGQNEAVDKLTNSETDNS